ncbi:TPA: conjugal transfer protein TraL [Campylobacter fetus subsp. venerealis]|nr:conjugal transfer protein TraL [Campylobacter fetus subsp. venerealis]HDX6315317.1 conjugal transfer protein TraL [Campylobacter fetus subsp. venerealis]HDX8126111.1 conjugal transfer protein TraL [Campylobacter fetus subsp. venerealis]HDX8133971.1 conjugal transfer protein TraL [Campylobacter fetus subsp. venerealis]HDX8141302.1 conjugal transfer protein TraL [Campylobacter fetus subsp. venerealis]
MTNIHFILNGKGGIGKSFISSLICQYLLFKSQTITAIDTDPNNTTLFNIKAIKAKFLQLIDEDGKFDNRAFDKIIELAADKKTNNYIVDSGATTFIPLIDYLKENEAIEILKANKIDVYMHIPIVGGQSKDDTILGLRQLVEAFDCSFIVWINEYHGAIKDFEENPEYIAIKDKIKAIIYLNAVNKDTFGKDLLELTSKNLTFDEAMNDKSFSLMSKQRLKIFKDKAFKQLEIII